MDLTPMNPPKEKEILDAKEVAQYLHLHLFTVHKFAREGRLPAFKVGKDWRFRRCALEEWMKAQEQDHAPRKR